MSSLLSTGKRWVSLALMGAAAWSAFAQNAASPQGFEYSPTGPILGDQVFARLGINASGGYLVWQDNVTDGNGLGIGARRLDSTLNGTLGTFRVNEITAGDQEKPRVALLANGGAVFVWQGGTVGSQHIFARFLSAAGTFVTGDVMANTYQAGFQSDPVVACLTDGSVVVVWSSYGQDGSLLGVYGQRFSAVGQRLGTEFQVNQTKLNNQRSPAVAALPGGRFVVVWISESYQGTTLNVNEPGGAQDGAPGVQLYDVLAWARFFDAEQGAQGNEFAISSRTNVAANPVVCAAADGGFQAAWSGRVAFLPPGSVKPTDSWDVFARGFDSQGKPRGGEYRVNAHVKGDQYLPKIAAIGSEFLVIWTSLGQDGSREGVFGRTVGTTGPVGDELLINTTTISQQVHPEVASEAGKRALVVWSCFVGGLESFDLVAQRFTSAPDLPAPAAPFLSALSQSRISVTWAEMAGYPVAEYLVYLDDGSTGASVQGNHWTATGLQAGSTHTFRLAYKLADGTVSPSSAPSSGRTWGEDVNFDGLPDDWQSGYWGNDPSKWPGAKEDADGDGATNLQEFLAGTNPSDPDSVLKIRMDSTEQGLRLVWNTQPGLLYQVQLSANLGTWTDLGSQRFAPGSVDSVPVDGGQNLEAYRVIRIR